MIQWEDCKGFCIKFQYKNCLFWVGSVVTPRFHLNQIWISLPYICDQPTIIVFSPVIHEKRIFKGICYINLYTCTCRTMSSYSMAIWDPSDYSLNTWTNMNLDLLVLIIRVVFYMLNLKCIQASSSREDV